jgi:hypothetical protein
MAIVHMLRNIFLIFVGKTRFDHTNFLHIQHILHSLQMLVFSRSLNLNLKKSYTDISSLEEMQLLKPISLQCSNSSVIKRGPQSFADLYLEKLALFLIILPLFSTR